MESDKRIAVLIDADNVSDKYIRYILDELSKYGTPTYKRIYGDWTKPQMISWKNVLLTYSITPIQQYSYTVGKNATDSSLIIDAMDILYSKNVDSFCIVSSDSDFTRLAARLREAGMYVIGMGEKKTPTPFISACETFKYLDVLAAPPAPAAPHAPSGRTPHKQPPDPVAEPEAATDGLASLEVIRQAMKAIITETSDEEGWAFLGTVGSVLTKRYPDFDTRNYGFSKLSPFVASLGAFDIEYRKTSNPSIRHTYIRNKDAKNGAKG